MSMSDTRSLNRIQIGLPKLPEIKSPMFYRLLFTWLQDCDLSRTGCNRRSYTFTNIPTRLIDVGQPGHNSLTVYLREMADSEQRDSLRYIALSHPWGSVDDPNHSCTTRKNVESRLMDGIAFSQLPNTFRHAVQVTRALGIRYLCIDSLCIMQGADGDFETEARNMETVFSSAYCDIAASRASGTSSGFLWKRTDRRYVKIGRRPSEDPLYICESIDDFQHDVVEGPLNPGTSDVPGGMYRFVFRHPILK